MRGKGATVFRCSDRQRSTIAEQRAWLLFLLVGRSRSDHFDQRTFKSPNWMATARSTSSTPWMPAGKKRADDALEW